MFRIARWVRICLFVPCALSSFIAVAQPSQEKVKRVQAMAPLLDLKVLPRCLQIMERQLQTHYPDIFVKGFGNGAKLGSEWRPGNPSYDKAKRLLEKAIQEEEAAQGKPIIQIDTGKVAPFIAENLSDDEIRGLARMLKSELGQAYFRVGEAGAVPQFLKEMEKLDDISPEVQAQIDEIKQEGKRLFTESVLRVMELERKHPDDVQDFKQVMGRLNEGLGEKLGERLVSDSMSRVLSLSYDLLPQLRMIVKEFKSFTPPSL